MYGTTGDTDLLMSADICRLMAIVVLPSHDSGKTLNFEALKNEAWQPRGFCKGSQDPSWRVAAETAEPNKQPNKICRQ